MSLVILWEWPYSVTSLLWQQEGGEANGNIIIKDFSDGKIKDAQREKICLEKQIYIEKKMAPKRHSLNNWWAIVKSFEKYNTKFQHEQMGIFSWEWVPFLLFNLGQDPLLLQKMPSDGDFLGWIYFPVQRLPQRWVEHHLAGEGLLSKESMSQHLSLL